MSTLLPSVKTKSWILDATRNIRVQTPAAIMGIVNATPDSFSDGGQVHAAMDVQGHAQAMIAAGAAWLDVGGESTRPGSAPVDAATELARVLPVIAAMRGQGARISIDTSKGAVARAALAAGAEMVNDVTAGSDPDLLAAVADAACPLVLMHMQGVPATMQQQPHYDHVVDAVRAFLLARMAAAVAAGIAESALVLDPGIGFGKTLVHNLALLQALPVLARDTGRPLLVGLSRKSFLVALSGMDFGGISIPPEQRDGLSHCLHTVVAGHCALLRVHDVAGTNRALRLAAALRGEKVT